MDLLIDAQLPGTLRAGRRRFSPRRFALPAPGLNEPSRSRRLILAALFDLLIRLAEYVDLSCQRLLQDFFEIFTQMPTVKHLFGLRGSFVCSRCR
jgi:hypothetical protein